MTRRKPRGRYDITLGKWVTDHNVPIDEPAPLEPDPEVEDARRRWTEWEAYKRSVGWQ